MSDRGVQKRLVTRRCSWRTSTSRHEIDDPDANIECADGNLGHVNEREMCLLHSVNVSSDERVTATSRSAGCTVHVNKRHFLSAIKSVLLDNVSLTFVQATNCDVAKAHCVAVEMISLTAS